VALSIQSARCVSPNAAEQLLHGAQHALEAREMGAAPCSPARSASPSSIESSLRCLARLVGRHAALSYIGWRRRRTCHFHVAARLRMFLFAAAMARSALA
jgi:hypothetical protein